MSKQSRERARHSRRQAEQSAAIARLRSAGKSCGNCEHFEKAPFGMTGHICGLCSEFSGYQTAVASGVCSKHLDNNGGISERD